MKYLLYAIAYSAGVMVAGMLVESPAIGLPAAGVTIILTAIYFILESYNG